MSNLHTYHVDLYISHAHHDDIIKFINNINKELKSVTIIGMIEQARKTNSLTIDSLLQPENDSGEHKEPKRTRLVISKITHPELIEFWDSLPHGSRSAFFIALLRQTLISIKRGNTLLLENILSESSKGEQGAATVDRTEEPDSIPSEEQHNRGRKHENEEEFKARNVILDLLSNIDDD